MSTIDATFIALENARCEVNLRNAKCHEILLKDVFL